MELGGNLLRTIRSDFENEVTLAEAAYLYKILKLKKNSAFKLPGLKSACLYLLAGQLRVGTEVLSLNGDSLQIENAPVEGRAEADNTTLLVVGSLASFFENTVFKKCRYESLKTVNKPWGYEIWITGEHPGYSLKKIFIKKETKTSLQYHQIKRETNVLFEGQVHLHYKNNVSVANDAVSPQDLSTYLLNPVTCLDVPPLTLHRLEALSDVLLYEASTPHLDDVIRVKDDTKRQDGRVEAEHAVKKQ